MEDQQSVEELVRRAVREALEEARPRPAPEPHVLELRIHGISNTPPHGMLEVPADDVENLRGDTLGSFWGLTPEATARARALPATDHRHVAPDVHREAYSWGQTARTTPGAPGGGGNAWVQRLSRAGWMFLVPMGLANAAYWSRRLDRRPERFGRGAGSVRLFGLGLTLLVVIAAQVVSLDLVGTQCFRTQRGAEPDAARCPALPAFLASLEAFTWSQRLAVMSLVPVAVLLLLYWLSAGSRVRYEQPTADVARATADTPVPGVDDAGPATAGDTARATAGSTAPARAGDAGPAAAGDAGPATAGDAGPAAETDDWTLAQPTLWSRWALTTALARLHFAAGLALTAATAAAADIWGGLAACGDVVRVLALPECRAAVSTGRWPAVLLFLTAVLLLGGSAWLVVIASYRKALNTSVPGSPQPRRAEADPQLHTAATLVLGLSATALAAVLLLLWGWGRESRGTDVVHALPLPPGLLVGALLAVALVAATWRAEARSRTRGAALGAALLAASLVRTRLGVADDGGAGSTAGVADAAGRGDALPWVLAVAGALLLLGAAIPWPDHRRELPLVGTALPLPGPRRASSSEPGEDPRTRGCRSGGWRGTAPAVFLVLSLGVAVMLTSILVVSVGDWLNGSLSAQCLAVEPSASSSLCGDAPRTDEPGPSEEAAAASGTPVPLTIPRTYTVFTTLTPLALALAVAIVLTGLAIGTWRARKAGGDDAIPSAADGLPLDEAERRRSQDLPLVQPAGRTSELFERQDLLSARLRTRRLAGSAKRAELVLAALAAAYAGALAFTIWWAVVEPSLLEDEQWARPLPSLGLWTTALLWTALLVRIVTQSSAERPLGIVWDLMCFLPRSAHPFGPPCYAERVVPEVSSRVLRWLDATPETSDAVAGAPDGSGQAPGARERVVVLSAHSLGAVLAIAAVFALPSSAGRVGLLTYGTQVRAYFGRFFPELLGPEVTGTVPCPAPRLTAPDPWPRPEQDDDLTGRATDPPRTPDTLVERLGATGDLRAAWVSLWRSTDPLGMPVASDAPNHIDRGAEELDTTAYVATVATHGGYPRVAAYRHAFGDVLGRLDAIRAAHRA